MEEPKRIIRVLLAERDDEFRRIVAAAMEQCGWIDLIASVKDGAEALRITLEKRPDVVVLDAMLAQLDGVTIAALLKKERLPIDVVLLTFFVSPQFSLDCHYLKVAAVLQKPLLTQTILTRLEVLRDSKGQQQERDQELLWQKSVVKMMHVLGIPQGTKGYLYINRAILYDLMHEGAASNITKQIYPELAAKFDNKPENVERVIRNAIEKIVEKGNRELLEEYFGPVSTWKKGHPTNVAFIARASELLRQGEIEQMLQTD